MIKSRHEIDLMRLASRATLIAYEAAYHSMKVGMTQHDVADMLQNAHRKLGFEGGADVQAQLPVLSAYLGHSCPEATYWYFQATPELRQKTASINRQTGQREVIDV